MIEMKKTARFTVLLVLAGILVLSVPLLAGNRARASKQVAAQVQSSSEVAAPNFMQSVMAAVRAQIAIWFHAIPTSTVKPEVKPSVPDVPVKNSRPFLPKSKLDSINLDHGGDEK
jgi:hypothetical protein